MRNTTLCYIEQGRDYLMLHRVKKTVDENKDKWIGIGGKFEEGESPEDCLIREVREETGFKVRSWNYRGIITFVSDKWGTEYMHLFHSDDFTGDMHPCDEGEAEWVDISRVLDLNLWVGDRIFLKYLLDKEMPFFSLKLMYRGDDLVKAVLNGQEMEI